MNTMNKFLQFRWMGPADIWWEGVRQIEVLMRADEKSGVVEVKRLQIHPTVYKTSEDQEVRNHL